MSGQDSSSGLFSVDALLKWMVCEKQVNWSGFQRLYSRCLICWTLSEAPT